MAPDPDVRANSPDSRDTEGRPAREADEVLATLGDSDCRALLERLADGALTAKELSRVIELPSSTLYRKIEQLVDSGLVAEDTKISTGGRNATLYEGRVDELSVRFDGSEGIELETVEEGGTADSEPSVDGGPVRNGDRRGLGTDGEGKDSSGR